MLNKRFIDLLAICLIFFLSPTVAAEVADLGLVDENFAFSAAISTGKQSVRQFEIPYEVLQGIQRQDYGDMRIFNNQNQSIPFSVTVVKPQSQQHSNEYELDFFTLPNKTGQHQRMQIEIDKYMSRFSFKALSIDSDKQSYIIIKNAYSDKDLDKLQLSWAASNHAFSVKLKLEQSDDLEHWRTIKHNTTLYYLKHDSTLLIKDTIFFPKPSNARYLRISFNQQHDFLSSVIKISGYYRHQSQIELENWKTLTLKPGENAHEWLFNTDSVAPVIKIAFDIPQSGMVYQGTLFSKHSSPIVKPAISNKSQFKKEVKKILHYPNRKSPEQNNTWQYQQRFAQFRLLTESGEINSQALSMPNIIKDSLWRIVLKQPLTLLPEQVPKINIAWHPVILTFLAQGEGPYRLLFGNPNMKPLRSSLNTTLTDGQIETVMLDTVNIVKKPLSTTKSGALASWFKQMNWQKILLWLLLCSFVLLMATMAYKLYLDMNK